ncbi:MAG: alkene reductase [Desulfopila sp.]
MSAKRLFEQVRLGDLTLKNSIAMAPMTRGRAGKSRVANAMMADHYSQRSSAGLLITEGTSVSPQAIGWVGSPGIYTEEMAEGWRLVTDRVHAAGSRIFLQLWHCGRASYSDFHGGDLPVSASAIKLNGDMIHTPFGKKAYEVPRALTVAEIRQTIDDYRQAAQYAREAGFDGVELHCANGYLPNQFLDPKSNRRTDEYGGGMDNRYRFVGEVLAALCAVWPSQRVGIRLSPNGVFNDMGSGDFRETYLYVIDQLARLDLGYVHIMDGLAFGFHGFGEPMTLAEIRERYSGTLIGNCGYSLEDAEERIEAGVADIACIGRPFITNPDLVERWRNGWPLAPCDDMSLWYTAGPEGYNDYPPYQSQR